MCQCVTSIYVNPPKIDVRIGAIELNEVSASDAQILVVDDNPLIVNVLKGLLSEEDYKVHTCANGKEALELLDSEEIDLIICDVMMPYMNGYELHDSVRCRADLSHIPFVFLTALGDARDIKKGREAGADDYVVKPFDPDQLLSLVKGKVFRSKNIKELSAEKYDGYRKRVIHTLSHEFRTPLVAISTGTDLLLEQFEDLEPSKVKALLEAIQRGGQRLERLVSDFVILQQLDAGVAERTVNECSKDLQLQESIERYARLKERWFKERGYSLEVKNPEVMCVVKAFERYFHEILDRVVDNAVKFSELGSTVTVSAYCDQDNAVIEVRDQGPGIEIEKMNKSLSAFQQINREENEQQGSGLGLSIASRYTGLHGGRLEFENSPEGGAIVKIVLPLSSLDN